MLLYAILITIIGIIKQYTTLVMIIFVIVSIFTLGADNKIRKNKHLKEEEGMGIPSKQCAVGYPVYDVYGIKEKTPIS